MKRLTSSNPKWVKLGTFTVAGSVTEWESALYCRRLVSGYWEFRVKPEEGDSFDFGPGTLRDLYNELVETYDLNDGEELLEMFQSSENTELQGFRKPE